MSLGISPRGVRCAQVYLIEGDLSPDDLASAATGLLASPVLDEWTIGAASASRDAQILEVHPLPGVMDPAAQTVRDFLRRTLDDESIEVSTGRRYDLTGLSEMEIETLGIRLLANPVIHAIHRAPFHPEALPHGHAHPFEVRRIPIRALTDADLERLSRNAHLFLDLHEMRAIQEEYDELDREPTDIELETLAQTWSEHCVHKTLKSRVMYQPPIGDDLTYDGRPGHTVQADGSVLIDNLLRSTVAAATHELIADGVDWTLSVFVDNAGVIEFDDEHAVCVKVETHNHPSAIEPYGGAATGVGGCIRDVIGTGLAAKPIANTDVFCVAPPETRDVPAGCLAPRRILTNVVAGVRDYGNRMGIPTINGAVSFDERYIGNPLVYCGCVGVMPKELATGDAKPGDLIVALGGRTGRDGIHGATFSSAELTDTHADEFSHAVQIGNAIEEKKVLDAILRARDAEGGPLYSAITDCGAGGFSSAVGEMGERIGAEVHLERAPLKYAGLSYTEIWISEAQERMVLSVPEAQLERLRTICDDESVEMCVLGVFGTPNADLILNYDGVEVGRLPMDFLHNGIPTPKRVARSEPIATENVAPDLSHVNATDALLKLLSHPNIASKHWIVRQYDHEVQGATAVKPLVGPGGVGPGDASVILPVPLSTRGLAVGCGLATGMGDTEDGGDPHLMALAAIDECVRNLVCVGADPSRIAILDNFCWPACAREENLGSLVRAAEGCYDGAMAYRTPFVSGKDSLNNQFTTDDGRTIEIPPTLLISGIGIVHDVRRCVTSDAKRAGNLLVVIGEASSALGGSHFAALMAARRLSRPRVDLEAGPRNAERVARLISEGVAVSAHDCSDGGLLVAVAEMLIGSSGGARALGADLDLGGLLARDSIDALSACFGESASRYVVEIDGARRSNVEEILDGAPYRVLGEINESGRLGCTEVSLKIDVDHLVSAWRGPLDW